jgi:hypothetical protein
VAAHDDGAKVGQIALVRQTICWNGVPCPAIQLIDLWILKAYRSPRLIRLIYKEAERLCVAQNIHFIVAMPNENSRLLNERFLKLKPALLLNIRAGIAVWRPRSAQLKYSGHLKALTEKAAVELLSSFATGSAETGLRWNGNDLFERTNDPTCDYAAHATADLLLISSLRKTWGIKYTLLCGFFTRSQSVIAPRCVRELVRTACCFWKHPFFVYAGINKSLPALPGIALPHRLRQPMLIQLRHIDADRLDVRFDRFQLIDSDFA